MIPVVICRKEAGKEIEKTSNSRRIETMKTTVMLRW